MIKVKTGFFFIKEIETMFAVFLSRPRVEVWENTKSLHFLFFQASARVAIKQLDYDLEISITHRNQK